jgi:hypothetical protein
MLQLLAVISTRIGGRVPTRKPWQATARLVEID